MADFVNIGAFQNIVSVNWPKAGHCGLLLQVGRFHSSGSAIWQVFCSAGHTINAGTFQGSTPSDHFDSLPNFPNIAFNLVPPYDTTSLQDSFGFAGNAGNRAAVFNFQRDFLAFGSIDDFIEAQISLNVSPGSNTSQWHFMFDTFRVGNDGANPTFSQGTDPDNSSIFGETGLAPRWVPTVEILDTGRLYVPQQNGSNILTSAVVKATVNTRTGQISAIIPPPP